MFRGAKIVFWHNTQKNILTHIKNSFWIHKQL